MRKGVDEFAYLWTTQREEWVVLQPSCPQDIGLPFNLRTRHVLLIDEDDALADSIIRRMIAEGMPVVETVHE